MQLGQAADATAESEPELESDLSEMWTKVADLSKKSEDRLQSRDLLSLIQPGFRLAARAGRPELIRCLRDLLARSTELGLLVNL